MFVIIILLLYEKDSNLLNLLPFGKTAFSPAGPYFDDKDESERLDSGDADFVDCIHTDRRGMGSSRNLGSVDIDFNGGSNQPGATSESALLDALLSVGGSIKF